MTVDKRQLTDLQHATEAIGRGNWAVSVVGKRLEEVLYADADGTTKTLPAAAAYDATDSVDVFKSRLIHLNITVTGGAAGSAVSFIPEISSAGDAASNTWYPLGVTDGIPSEADLDAAPSSEYTLQNYNAVVYRPLEIRTATFAGTETQKMSIPIDVSGAKHFRLRLAETGTSATPSSVKVTYSKST